MPSLTAVVFDMDGVLVDSEPLWHEAEIEAFAKRGLTLSKLDCQQTTGVRIDQVVVFWRERCPEAFVGVDDRVVVDDIIAGVAARIAARGEAMAGVAEAIDDVARRGLRIGLASSSPQILIDAVLDRLQLRPRFAAVVSAERMPRGKPDPAVYLEACHKLGVSPEDAVAVEDSSSGIVAGKNAGMFVVAIPDAAAARPAALDRADVVIASLRELPAVLDRLSADRASGS